ncbi:PAS domain S-box protein [Chryseolinea sp. Jin1]|uniref:histidine kinase n=2 Tax=Chryseolinea lacunae TaxID=2801331 RepID=A0ABS1L2I1_9BACT|nr:PAS domain S-box protein [Chryseolinea lacunae]
MDLILAHKRVMKVCELTGFSLIIQTSIATAISEIARCAIEHGEGASLKLGIDGTATRKYLVARIEDSIDFSLKCQEALNYAKRLVGNIEVIKTPKGIQIMMKHLLNFSGTFTPGKIDSYADYFKNEPAISPYDELRRKNLLLQEFADKIRDSEDDYRTLTDSLPLMMFTLNNRGQLTYSNKWIEQFLGIPPKEITAAAWQNIVHPDDYATFNRAVTAALQKATPLKGQYRLKEKGSGNFVWHMITALPLKNEKDAQVKWMGFMVDIDAHRLAEKTLKDNMDLKEVQEKLFENQQELQTKIVELNRSNYELEQFAHLATHDLQEPLRKLFFYADALKTKYHDKFDASGLNMLKNMTNAVSRMKELITDLLNYSQLHQQKLDFNPVDLNVTVQDILKDFEITIQEKRALFDIGPLPLVNGHALRLRQLFSNLISNALKYSKKEVVPHIQISVSQTDEKFVFLVKDNGIGFEPQYKDRIFGLFERLHTRDQFPGTGIGLSICKRIVELHHGHISATAVPGEYSAFEIELPMAAVVN